MDCDACVKPASDASTQVTNGFEGYLFRRKSSVGATWARRYCKIQSDEFFYYTLPTSGRHKGSLISSAPIILAECIVRSSQIDRQNCFEIVGPKDFLTLQAESMQDYEQWISVLSRCACQSHIQIPSLMADSRSIPDDESGDLDESEIRMSAESDKGSQRLSFNYQDQYLKKRNTEMHHLFKSIPLVDCCVDVFQCFLQRDIAIQGRCFISEERICFYSNLIGFVNIVVIEYKDVTDILVKSGSFFTAIVITTRESSHSFKVQKADRQIAILNIAWKNSQIPVDNGRLGTQELLNQIAEQTKDLKKAFSAASFGKALSSLDALSFQSTVAGNIIEPVSETEVQPSVIKCKCSDHLDQTDHNIVLPLAVTELFGMFVGPNSEETWKHLDTLRHATGKKKFIKDALRVRGKTLSEM